MDEDFRYGQLAIEGRLITPDQFDEAMTRAKDAKRPLHEVLVDDGVLDPRTAERLAKGLRRIVRDERAKSEDGVLAHKHIGGYKLLRRIGEGGMGEVYLAEQLNMHRLVALKVLHDKWGQDEEFRKRFLLEARSAGKLSHQNLIQVYDVGKYQGMYYFSMEYIDGVTVEDLIEDEGGLSIEQTTDIVLQVCEVLKYLSKRDIVHRDIKPANVMITKSGEVKLGDLGFIRNIYDSELMQAGTTLGTPDYISPEQAQARPVLDVRSDIYSLGATMYHMLAGRTLFSGSCSQVMRDHIDVEPPSLDELRKDTPRDLVRILDKMLAKDPADRYQTAEELAADLEMLKIDVAAEQGRIPASRSQIMQIINAEKDRIKELAGELDLVQQQQRVWRYLALLGWVVAVLMLILTIVL
ncbi:MAG: serine/threonine protein kinase [Planctomycetota bacterium]